VSADESSGPANYGFLSLQLHLVSLLPIAIGSRRVAKLMRSPRPSAADQACDRNPMRELQRDHLYKQPENLGNKNSGAFHPAFGPARPYAIGASEHIRRVD
jgi:hypothetical protein